MRASLLLGSLILAGCGSEVPSPTERQELERAAASGAEASARPRVELTRTGLSIGDRSLPFATQQDEVIEQLQPVIGLPGNFTRATECGAGELFVVTYASGLTLNFQSDAFAGWFYDGSEGDFALSGGVGVGSNVSDLGASYRPIDSTLDGEFSYGDAIGGFAADGRISALYAGVNCFAR